MGLCFGSRTGSAQGSQEERASPGGSAAEEEAQSQIIVGVMVRRQGIAPLLEFFARLLLRPAVGGLCFASNLRESEGSRCITTIAKTTVSLLGFGLVFED